MSILPDYRIRELGASGAIFPFNPARVQPASYDATLADTFRVFDHHAVDILDLAEVQRAHTREVKAPSCVSCRGSGVDPVGDPQVLQPMRCRRCKGTGTMGIVIQPGESVLGHTTERIRVPDDCVVRVEGKSSIGRLMLIVHVTAGFVDPGFDGQITTEMVNLSRVPIRLRPGLPICQFAWQRMEAPPEQLYQGRYQDEHATGAVESRGVSELYAGSGKGGWAELFQSDARTKGYP